MSNDTAPTTYDEFMEALFGEQTFDKALASLEGEDRRMAIEFIHRLGTWLKADGEELIAEGEAILAEVDRHRLRLVN